MTKIKTLTTKIALREIKKYLYSVTNLVTPKEIGISLDQVISNQLGIKRWKWNIDDKKLSIGVCEILNSMFLSAEIDLEWWDTYVGNGSVTGVDIYIKEIHFKVPRKNSKRGSSFQVNLSNEIPPNNAFSYSFFTDGTVVEKTL